jgi:hypothetical protein
MTLGVKYAVILALQALAANAITVKNTILVIARDAGSASSATSGLQGYGIPFQTLLVPQTGATLPALNSSTTAGNFGGIVIMSEVAYQFSTGFSSALTAAQWNTLYDYQTSFGVRMVRLDVFPSADFGKTLAPSDYPVHNPAKMSMRLTRSRNDHGYRRRRLLRRRRRAAGQHHQRRLLPHGQSQDVSLPARVGFMAQWARLKRLLTF